jgi:hypothetical protein
MAQIHSLLEALHTADSISAYPRWENFTLGISRRYLWGDLAPDEGFPNISCRSDHSYGRPKICAKKPTQVTCTNYFENGNNINVQNTAKLLAASRVTSRGSPLPAQYSSFFFAQVPGAVYFLACCLRRLSNGFTKDDFSYTSFPSHWILLKLSSDACDTGCKPSCRRLNYY